MDRLLCALCGQPLSALEFVGRICRGQRLGWHLDCYERDLSAGHGVDADDAVAIPWETRVAIVTARGEGRVGAVVA